MLKTTGKLVNVSTVDRTSYRRPGISLLFRTKDFGAITRTYNLPYEGIKKNTVLSKLITSLKLTTSSLLENAPLFLASEIRGQRIDHEFELTLQPTGKDRYPYNIVEINPLY